MASSLRRFPFSRPEKQPLHRHLKGVQAKGEAQRPKEQLPRLQGRYSRLLPVEQLDELLGLGIALLGLPPHLCLGEEIHGGRACGVHNRECQAKRHKHNGEQ